ncbi:hydrolase [Asanoa ishikariensis]|uniref:Proline iminopeptidase n=1 Tax=Asanoa ishikariensis TaxID=137265 RepID=A0A1H3TIS7_9ACTN|nr:alpha/beta hydrolase [Asanoa ishikariensis]GIF62336.1 hydrolase [Asanoa ishikariensis]SDZ50222.1 proline iminopeptidase [Asanoa ishikariensis]
MKNLSPGTHSFTVDGTRQVYHVAGHGPVMIAHPGGPGVEYSYLRSTRLEEHFTMVYVEPVGTGESGPLPAGATYVDTYVDFLHALVENLDVPKVFLLGHSHGGIVAVRFALLHPDRTAGLALYSATPCTTDEFWAAEEANAAVYGERHPDVPEAAAIVAAATQWDEVKTDEQQTAILRTFLPVYFADFWGRRAEFDVLRENVRAWYTTFESKNVDYRPDLWAITAPTVVLTGRHDFICGPVWARLLHEGIPGSELVILENSGHFAQVEEPDGFLDAMSRLLGLNARA